MRNFVLLFALPLGLLWAAENPPKSKPDAIPAGAVKVDAETSRYTDAQGKTWIYRKTPFGLVKYEDKSGATAAQDAASAAAGKPLVRDTPFGKVNVPAAQAAKPAQPDQHLIDSTTVREQGDSLYFERPGPFGPFKWSRKKDQLNDAEKAIWERQKKTASGDGKARE